MSPSRRRFLHDSAAAWAGATMPPLGGALLPLARGQVAASDRLTVGVIGCNGMGFSDLRSMLQVPGVECAALCDVDRNALERRAGELVAVGAKQPQLYGDYRALLESPDIDAVIIGTPDHWHCLQTVAACEAGKHVYVEKPLANSIQECRVMQAAVERYGSVVQVGQWQRSGPHWEEAVELVRSGELGRIRAVRVWAYMDWLPEVPNIPDEPTPEGVDYDMWLGPAPSRPFNRNRFHFNFRWFWDYAGGLMTDWGVHLIDMALYGMDAGEPVSVVANGGKFAYPDDAEETPDTMQAIYEFDEFSMIWEHAVGIGLGPFQRSHGVVFIGNNGTMVVDRAGWEVFPEVSRQDGRATYKIPARPVRNRTGRSDLDRHTENFIDAIRNGAVLTCDVTKGADVAVTAHLGNIAFRTDGKVRWDGATDSFRDNAAADALAKASYREPWRLPEV